MCYTGGPRCSKSAKAILQKAMENGDHSARMRALDEYRHTPEGIAITRRTNPEYADLLQKERDTMLKYKKIQDEQIENSQKHLSEKFKDDNSYFYRKTIIDKSESIIDAHGREMNGEEAPYPNGYPHPDVHITPHLKKQMHEKGFQPSQIINAIKNPYKVTKVRDHPGQWRYCGDGVAVVMDKNKCITVHADGIRTPLRPDQMSLVL